MKRHLPLLLFGMSALCVAQVQNIPDTNFPTVRSFINSNFSYLVGALAGKQATLTNYTTITGLTGYPSTFPPVNSGNWAGTWQTYSPGYFEPALGNPSVTGYVLSSTTAGVRSWVPQSGTGSVTWDAIENPEGNLGLTMAGRTTTFTHGASTGSGNMWTWTDTTNNNGTGYMHYVNLASGSAMKPGFWAVNGNGVAVSNAGVLSKVGTGSVQADALQGRTVANTAPTDLQYLGWNSGATQWEPKTLLSTMPTVQAYNFTPYSCNMTTSVCTPGGTSSGTLSSGTHTLTFTPCPVGAASFVPASPHAFWYYVSGGSGTSEAVSVSGTTCTSGLSTGTMTLYALSYSHTGAFVIGSATAGAQEAAIAAGATNAGNPTGALYFPAGIYSFYAPVYIDNGARVFGDGTAESFIANLNGGNGLFDVDGGPAVSFSNLRMDSEGAVSSGNYAIRIGFNVETTFSSVDHVLFNNFYDEILGVSMNQLHVTDSTFYLFSHTGITVADALCTDCIGAFITSSAFFNYGYSTPAEAAVLVKSGSDIQISNSSMIGTGTTNLNWCVEALYAAGDGGEFHITGSKCEATALGGYSIAGYWPGTIISGNVLGNASASGWSGISLTGTGGTSKGWNVSGNLVNCSSAASSNGLYFQGTYSGSVVSGNTLDGCNFGINANGSPTNVVLGINNITNSLTSPVYVASSQVIVDGTTTKFNHYGLTDTSGGVGNAGDGSRLYCTDCNATCTAGSSTGRTCFKENGVWTH